MDQKELTALKNTATELRIRVIDMIWKAQSGHPGGSLSVADFVTACYFRYMNLRPEAGLTATASCSPKATCAPLSMRRWP